MEKIFTNHISDRELYSEYKKNSQNKQTKTAPNNWKQYLNRHFRRGMTSLITQLVKNLPAMQETPVLFLGREDLLEKG